MRATPDFDFALGENAEMIRETTARFADEQIAPVETSRHACARREVDAEVGRELDGVERRVNSWGLPVRSRRQGNRDRSDHAGGASSRDNHASGGPHIA